MSVKQKQAQKKTVEPSANGKPEKAETSPNTETPTDATMPEKDRDRFAIIAIAITETHIGLVRRTVEDAIRTRWARRGCSTC